MGEFKAVKVLTTISVPAKATHYVGRLFDDPTWLYVKVINESDHWFEYDTERDFWKLRSHKEPHGLIELASIIQE